MKRTIICIAAMSFLLSLGCGKKEDKVVANVGDRVITIGQFEKAAETMEEKYLPATADLAGKKELLDHMINKEIMVLKARAAGFQKDKDFIESWEHYKRLYLIAALENELVIKKVSVTDEEIKNYFEKMHNEYTLSQIVLADENQALAVREQLMAGADFEEMARKYSLSPDGADGGHIGSSTVGEMHHWVEEALFSMKEGEISPPLPTTTGYALIKVHSIRTVTPDHDLEYAGRRVRSIKEKQTLMELKKKIEKEIGLVIYGDAVDIVYNNLPIDIDFGKMLEGKITRDNAPKLEIPDQYLDMPIAQYSDSTYTLRDYVKIYYALPLPERPRRENGKEHVVESIHKRIWDVVLPAYAENVLKVQEIPEVGKGLKEREERFLTFALYGEQVRKDILVTNRDIEQYYNEHQEQMMSLEQRDFGVILVGSKEKADDVAALARAGGDWGKLAAKYSEDPGVKDDGGRMGLKTRGKYPDYDEVVFSIPAGRVSDPFETPRGWAVTKVFEIKPSVMVPLEKAMGDIQRALMETQAEKILKQKLEKWRKDYTIEIDEGNLKKASLKRLRPAEPAASTETQGR